MQDTVATIPLRASSAAVRKYLRTCEVGRKTRRRTVLAAGAILLTWCAACHAHALDPQAPSAPAATPAANAASAQNPLMAAPAPATPITDRLVFNTTAYCETSSGRSNTCQIGDTLYVSFANLKDWMAVSSNHISGVALVLNGRVLPGILPRGPDNSYNGLEFDLKRLDGDDPTAQANRATWNDLIAQLKHEDAKHRQILVAVASGGNPPFWGSVTLSFQIFPAYWWAVVTLMVVLLVAFFILARLSDIVRDRPTPPGGPKQSYSLARCQMAWWFFIVAGSYFYIFLTLGNYESVTTGVLILTGISAATGLASVAIDSNKNDQRLSLTQEQAQLESHIDELPALIQSATGASAATLAADLTQKASRLADVKASLAGLPSQIGASEGFLPDILRDESGVSFHRFQMLSWTLILSFIFIAQVHQQLGMPDFSPTLLGLMGISSGTYVGFKLPNPPK